MKNIVLTILLFIFLPGILAAHGSHGSGFVAGFTHPIFGYDHLLAILGIGILAPLIDDKKWYLHPLSFLILMIIGGLLGIEQEGYYIMELIIAFSGLIIGGLICFKLTKYHSPLLGLMAIFGFFHGFAHGTEMPETTTIFKYVSGYSVGTLLIFGIGYLIYRLIPSLKTSKTSAYIIGGSMICLGVLFGIKVLF